MRSFTESSDLLGDGEALRARLRADGYLFFRGLLDPAPLRALRSDILRVAADHGWIAAGTDPDDAVPSEPARFHAGPGWRDGYVAMQRLESFHRQAFDAAALAMLRALLDAEVLVHGQRIARVIWPSPDLTTPPHQDFTHIQGTPDVITTWVPLSAVPAAAGGLRVLAGSHTEGVRRVEPAAGAGGIRSRVADDDPNWVSVDYELGDLVCFHSLTVHGGRPNTSGRLRVSCDYRYQAVTDPVALPSTRPHNCPYVPDWPELLDGVEWETLRWAELPAGLDVRDFALPTAAGLDSWTDGLGTPASRLVPVPG